MERIKKNKTLTVLAILIALLTVLFLGKVTYSFLGPTIDDIMHSRGGITSQSGYSLTFSKGNDLDINASIDNFGTGDGNLQVSTNPTATLTNGTGSSVTATYVAGIIIAQNTFQYSTAGNTPELILTVLDENGNAVTTSSDSLTYVTSGGVSGFDVTNKKGAFNIVINHSITTSSTTTHTWTFRLTFVNLGTDQSINEAAKFSGLVTLQQDSISYEVEYANCTNPKLTNMYYMVCDEDLLACKVAKDFDYTDIENSKVVLHNGIVLDEANSCAILDAEDDSYRYTGGDYDVTQTAISAGYSFVNTYDGNKTGGVIGVKCNGSIGFVGGQCTSTKYYYLLYDTNETQYSTYDAAAAKAITDGYIVARNLNNYVCFGYDTSVPANETTCPEQNLYRMIGAFDEDNDGNYEVKLIKADYASTTEFGTNDQNGTSSYDSNFTTNTHTGYRGTQSVVHRFRWSGSNSNNVNRWDNSMFRSEVLNGYYLNTYLSGNDAKWKNMIKETIYFLGGIGKAGYTSGVPKAVYNAERSANAVFNSTYHTSIYNHIGLMYYSDYGYASKTTLFPSDRNEQGLRASGNDWIYNGLYEHTLMPSSSISTYNGMIQSNGLAYPTTGGVTYGAAIRPVMYLKSNVEVAKGTGAKSNPYYITLGS